MIWSKGENIFMTHFVYFQILLWCADVDHSYNLEVYG